MPIKCTYFRQNLDQTSSVVGTLGLHIEEWDLYFSKCKMIRTNEGKYFIAPPAEKNIDPETGENKYSNYWWFGKSASERFQKSAVDAVNSFIAKKEREDRAKTQTSQPAQSMSEIEDDLSHLPF